MKADIIKILSFFIVCMLGLFLYGLYSDLTEMTGASGKIAKSEVDVIHEYYSDKVIEEIKEGAEGSHFDKVVVFADGSKSYIKLNCSEDMDCEVEELE